MDIIPKPYHYEEFPGFFMILPKTMIRVFPANQTVLRTVKHFTDKIYELSEINLPIVENKNFSSFTINFQISKTDLGKEGYKLNINARYILLEAETEIGLFYGIQSLIQIIFKDLKYSPYLMIPTAKIEDKPRFEWRGMLLDVSRHFFDVDFIKRYIDYLSMFKFNIFHWHLTDDNGWRIEIKKYPELQKISAWRAERKGIDWRDCEPQKPNEKTNYGGYYSQKEIKEIIEYAAERHVTIIPEIEMPGHSLEVLAAFPDLSCSKGQYYVATGAYWPNKDILCAGNDAVFEFLENVLDEVVELFPTKYIHIGGDEANKAEWKKCNLCQKRIKEENLKDENDLQSWFIKKIADYLSKKGKQIIGWEEILEGNISTDSIIMSWKGKSVEIEAVKSGHKVVMCPQTHCYFDHYQADPSNEPVAIGGFTDLKKVYDFNPIPKELDKKESEYILGVQGNLWTEWIDSSEHAEYMIFPRMMALAEIAWNNQEKNWEDFKRRVNRELKEFDKKNINYCNHSFPEE